MAVVRVLLVDDQRPFLRAMAAVVEETPGFEVVGRAVSGEEAVTVAATLLPDLVLMDVNLPGIDGLEATRRILATASRDRGPAAVDLRRRGRRVLRRRVRCSRLRHQGGVRTGSARGGVVGELSLDDGVSAIHRDRHGPAGRLHPVADVVRAMPLRSVPVTTSLRCSSSTASSTRTGSSRSRVASAAQKYAAASTRGEKRLPAADCSTTRRPVPPARRDEGGQRSRQAGPGELRREHAPGDLAQRLERGIDRDEQPGQRCGVSRTPSARGRGTESRRSCPGAAPGAVPPAGRWPVRAGSARRPRR